MSGKYHPLYEHLSHARGDRIPMSFKEIEKIVGSSLPPSASRHRAWWSNNPSNSVITHAWLDAGFHTEQVDLASGRLVFRRVRPASGAHPGPADLPSKPSLFGALKGTIRIAPGTDLTEPTGVRWNAQGDQDGN